MRAFRDDKNRGRYPISYYLFLEDKLAKADHSLESWKHVFSFRKVLRENTKVKMIDTDGREWTLLIVEGFLCCVERIMKIARLKERPRTSEGFYKHDKKIHLAVWADDKLLRTIQGWIADREVQEWVFTWDMKPRRQ